MRSVPVDGRNHFQCVTMPNTEHRLRRSAAQWLYIMRAARCWAMLAHLLAPDAYDLEIVHDPLLMSLFLHHVVVQVVTDF